MQIEAHELIQKAIGAMRRAYAPYSKFQVGAALLTKDGVVFTGCNIENAAYSVTTCAERTAFFQAVSQGYREFSAIAIVGGPGGEIRDLCPPCGVCRQVMSEFCDGDFQIILTDASGKDVRLCLNELLPYRFSDAVLQKCPER